MTGLGRLGRWGGLLALALCVGCGSPGGGGAVPADIGLVDTAGPGDISAGDTAEADAPPDTAAPDTATPDTAAPDTATPDTAAPDTATPDTAAPDTAIPDTAPEDTAPADTAPEDTAHEDTAPEDTAPEDTAPQDTAPGDTAPQDTAPEDTAPEDVAEPGPDAPSDTDPVEDTAPTDVPDDVEPDASDDGGPVEPPLDCDAIPQGPFTMTELTGPIASEDLAFDLDGNLVGTNDQAIFKSAYQSQPKVWVPSFKFRAGLRFLPNGHLIVCDNNKGQLTRVDPDGVQHPILTGLSYPNGITVDLKGWVYFSEHDANQVWRVQPFTGEKTLLTDQISNPNGLTFSPDYKTLYIGGFSGVGTIYALSISPSGTPGKLVAWATDVGTGWLDGMAVDACGNVYIADYGASVIYRVSADGKQKKVVIDSSQVGGAYMPNMQWGSGIGGWDSLSFYIPEGWQKGVFEVPIGVPGKKEPYP